MRKLLSTIALVLSLMVAPALAQGTSESAPCASCHDDMQKEAAPETKTSPAWRLYFVLFEQGQGWRFGYDAKNPNGWASKEECKARQAEVLPEMVARGAEAGVKVLSRCSSNTPEEELEFVTKALSDMGKPKGTDI